MPRSQAEVRWAHAVLEGKAVGDRKYAQEVVDKMHGRHMGSLPKHTAAKHKAPAHRKGGRGR